MNRRLLIVLAVLLLAVATSWLSRHTQKVQQAKQAARHVPDFYLERFTTTTMGAAGKPSDRLEGQRAVHYGDDNTMDVTAPHLILYRAEGAPWRLDAASAHVEGSRDRIHLKGDVRLEQHGPKPVTVLTDHALVRPKARYASTDAEVTATYPGTRITAVGMHLRLASERLTLLSRVRGTYAPPKH